MPAHPRLYRRRTRNAVSVPMVGIRTRLDWRRSTDARRRLRRTERNRAVLAETRNEGDLDQCPTSTTPKYGATHAAPASPRNLTRAESTSRYPTTATTTRNPA